MADSKLNDPAARIGRAEGMQMMAERRRETVAAEMSPEDRAAYEAGEAAPAAAEPAPADAVDGVRSADARPEAKSAFEIAAALEAAAPAPSPAAPALPPGPAVDAELDLTRKVKLKVNGAEVERTLGEVIADAQKVSAADEYLQKSRDQLHSINALFDEARAKVKSDPAAAPAAPPADTTLEDPATEGVAALFRGDEDKAKEAFRKLASPALDTAKVVTLVLQQVKQERTLDEARTEFLQAHPDADTHPMAVAAANTALREELQRVGVPSLEALQPQQIKPVFDAASKAMTAWRGTGQTTPGGVAPTLTRADKKAAIDELPAASARATTQEAPPKTNSSVIAAMRAARPGSGSSVH